MKFYSIGEFSKLIGRTPQTLRDWDKKGVLKPAQVAQSGYRYYSQDQLNHFLGLKNVPGEYKKKTIGYCRVSSNKQKGELERQIENVKAYMYARGYQFEIITDLGSGVDYGKKGLCRLLDMVTDSQVERIVVLYKDRLISFGDELVENICRKFGTAIEVIDSTDKEEQQELVEDLVQIMTVFSCRLRGKRAGKAKKMIKELLEDDKDSENHDPARQ